MGILDEAIREHLELKRQHGVGDSELKQLEDDAFGPPERPGSEVPAADPFAEAPTEFLEQPETAEGDGAEAAEQVRSRRDGPSIADLQEAPEPAPAVEVAEAEEPAEEEHPAMEHETVAEEPAGHTTEERHAIAEQPTELHDIEEELASEGSPSPSDEELIEEEIAEPRLAPTDPLAGLEEDEDAEVNVQGPAPEEDEEFWNEQRLSDELDQALEAPSEPEPEPEPEHTDEHEADEPESTGEHEAETESPRHDEDLLEETPDFLEETPEDDELWFEQKPPKDFDFDD